MLESGLFVRIKKTSARSDSTVELQDVQPLSNTSEQTENVDKSDSTNDDDNQLICDAEVYENQFTITDD